MESIREIIRKCDGRAEVVDGIWFFWCSDLGFYYNNQGWPVQIFPPCGTREDWYVVVAGKGPPLSWHGKTSQESAFLFAVEHVKRGMVLAGVRMYAQEEDSYDDPG